VRFAGGVRRFEATGNRYENYLVSHLKGQEFAIQTFFSRLNYTHFFGFFFFGWGAALRHDGCGGRPMIYDGQIGDSRRLGPWKC